MGRLKSHFQRIAIMAILLSIAPFSPAEASATGAPSASGWMPSWYASPAPAVGTPILLNDKTVREIVRLTAGGDAIRLRLSNAYGTIPLRLDQVSVGQRQDGNRIKPGSIVKVTFGGHPDVTIAPGAYMESDPVAIPAAPDTELAVSIHATDASMATVHLQRKAAYLAAGDYTGDEAFPGAPTESKLGFMPWLSEVLVAGTATKGVIVAFGDSITDASGQKADVTESWPDLFHVRLGQAGITLGVANAGISGNRLLHDGLYPIAGAAGLARFDRDVLAQPNVRAVIMLIGINDLGQVGDDAPDAVTAQALEEGYAQLAMRAHERGLKIYAATITPFKGAANYYSAVKETKRLAVNAWLRSCDLFDGVIDFEKAVGDPQNPDQLLPSFDGGDHLHPNAEGNKAMAAAIPLNWFQ